MKVYHWNKKIHKMKADKLFGDVLAIFTVPYEKIITITWERYITWVDLLKLAVQWSQSLFPDLTWTMREMKHCNKQKVKALITSTSSWKEWFSSKVLFFTSIETDFILQNEKSKVLNELMKKHSKRPIQSNKGSTLPPTREEVKGGRKATRWIPDNCSLNILLKVCVMGWICEIFNKLMSCIYLISSLFLL